MKAIAVVAFLLAAAGSAWGQRPLAVFLEVEEEPAVRAYQREMAAPAQGRSLALRQQQAATLARAQRQRIQDRQANLRAALPAAATSARELYALRDLAAGLAVLVDPDEVAKLQALPGVRRIRSMQPAYPHAVAAADGLIGAAAAWGGGTNLIGKGIRIGIVDTGIDYLHADFGGPGGGYTNNDTTRIDDLPGYFPNSKVVGGWDFCGDDYDIGTLPRPDPDPMDCQGHGTPVAGVAAGYGVTTNGTTYAGPYGPASPSQGLRIPPGIAPGAKLYALRIAGCAGPSFLIPQAIEWAMDPDGDGSFADRLDVLNLSYGSAFMPPDDLLAVALDEAVQAGIAIAVSSGNSYGTFCSSGHEGDRVVGTAASYHDTYWTYAVRVHSPSSISGRYEAAASTFTPPPGASVFTNIVYADPSNACSALVNASAVSNRICLIDRGGCNFDVKVKNAQNAGARAVIMVNNQPGAPFTMGGSDTSIVITAVMISQAAGGAIKSNLAGGVKAELSSDTVLVWTQRTDTIVDYSSMGPSLSGHLTPDITAPTEIMAPSTGSGSGGRNFNGTSCSSPVIAGALALLRERFPADTPEELKARLLNAATHDLYFATNGAPPKWHPGRAGAGRVDITNALAATLLAYATNAPGTVHASFGLLAAGVVTQAERQVRIVNRAGAAQSVTLAIESAADVPGAVFSLPGGTNLSLAAGAATTVVVRLTATRADLRNTHAPAVTETQDTTSGTLPRYWMPEESGYLLLRPSLSAPLRLALHAVVRPASSLSCASTQIVLAAASGATNLALAGLGVNTGTSFPSNWVSLTSAFGLQWRGTNPPAYAGLQAFGAMTDWKTVEAGGGAFSNAFVAFGFVLSQLLPTPNGCLLEIHVDLNHDGVADRIVNWDSYRLPGQHRSDVLCGWVSNTVSGEVTYQSFLNGTWPDDVPTGVHFSRVYFLLARAGDLGLSTSNSSFRYHIETAIDEDGERHFRDQTPARTYDVANPGLWWPTAAGHFLRPAQPGTNIVMNYNRAACASNGVTGVLLLHHLNEPSQQAEYIPIAQTNLVTGTLYVARSGTHVAPFTNWTIAATNPVDAANLAADGARVLVSNGVYGLTQPVKMERGFTLASLNGATAVVFNGRGVVRCLEINHPNARVENLSLSNGAALRGGAVFIHSGGGTMSGCIIRNSAATNAGGGVYLDGAGVLTQCVLQANRSADDGGGAYLEGGGRLVSCELTFNRATNDGGGAATHYGGELITCTGRYNQSLAHGGAVAMEQGGLIDGGLYLANTSRWGGAIGMSTNTYMMRAVLEANRATENGGAIVFDRSGYASNVVLRGNVAQDSAGGAMLYYGGVLQDSLVESNTAQWGGGVQCNGDDDHGYVLGCTIRGNTVPNGGGGARFWLGGIVRDCVIEYNRANQGGGVETTGNGGWVDQCTIRHNYATNAGGGIKFSNAGLVTFCEVVSNTAPYGGAANFETSGKMDGCRVFYNNAPFYGGAAYCNGGGQIHNSLLAHNTSPRGGALFIWYGGEFINCTIVSNIASTSTGGTWNEGGGRYTNCIIHHNVAPAVPNYTNLGSGMAFTKVCAWPLPPGSGNFTNAPLLSFAATNFGVPLAGSPCINAGTNLPWMAGATDPYGMKRIVGPAPDIGACEYPFTTSGVSAAWLMEHSLFTDGSADFADDDGDGQDNYREWRSRTNPRDARSVFKVSGVGFQVSGPVVRWSSESNLTYRVERTTNLMTSFSNLRTNIPATPPLNVHTDETVSGRGPWLYRVEVE